jgi:hypothetical protein
MVDVSIIYFFLCKCVHGGNNGNELASARTLAENQQERQMLRRHWWIDKLSIAVSFMSQMRRFIYFVSGFSCRIELNVSISVIICQLNEYNHFVNDL